MFERIVEGLTDNGFAVADGFLSHEEATALLKELLADEKKGLFKKAGIGKQHQHTVDQKIRGDMIRWIDLETAGDALRIYSHRINDLLGYLNRTCYLGLKDFEMHFAIYPEGSYYNRHLDQFRHDDHRKISVVCYLNKDWTIGDGGQLVIYQNDGANERSTEILPLLGRLVCFRSDLLEHEVKPAKKDRYSITGWMLDQSSSLAFLK